MTGLTLHDLVNDVAMCIREMGNGPVVMLGQAFGNVLARVVTTDYRDVVKAVVLAAAEGSKVPDDIGKTPFVAGDPLGAGSGPARRVAQGVLRPEPRRQPLAHRLVSRDA